MTGVFEHFPIRDLVKYYFADFVRKEGTPLTDKIRKVVFDFAPKGAYFIALWLLQGNFYPRGCYCTNSTLCIVEVTIPANDHRKKVKRINIKKSKS